MSWSLTLQGSPYSHMYVLCSSAEQWDPAKSGTAFGVSRSDAPVKLEQLWSVLQCFTVLSQGDCVYYHVQTCMYTHHGHVIFNHLTSVNMGQFFLVFLCWCQSRADIQSAYRCICTYDYSHVVFVSSKKILKGTRSLDLHRCQAGCGGKFV